MVVTEAERREEGRKECGVRKMIRKLQRKKRK
jgi:hypothetical protein